MPEDEPPPVPPLALSLANVPVEVFVSHIAPCLDAADLRALAATSAWLRRIVTPLRVIRLSRPTSNDFAADPSFRDRVCAVLPRDRLSLTVTVPHLPRDKPFDASVLHGVHILFLLGGLVPNSLDVSGLGDVHKLRLHCCDVTDLTPLSAVHTVALSMCHSVTDVSPLRNVHTVTLMMCNQVVDVSALGAVHTLSLVRLCVSDVSGLGRVHKLLLKECNAVRDLSPLHSVHSLSVVACKGFSSIAALGTVHTLSFADCAQITDVSPLRTVHSLTLDGCHGIVDVSALGSVHTLTLKNCHCMRDSPALRSVRRLTVEHCINIPTWPPPREPDTPSLSTHVQATAVAGSVQDCATATTPLQLQPVAGSSLAIEDEFHPSLAVDGERRATQNRRDAVRCTVQ